MYMYIHTERLHGTHMYVHKDLHVADMSCHTDEFKEAMKVGAKLGVLNFEVKGKVSYSSVDQTVRIHSFFLSIIAL